MEAREAAAAALQAASGAAFIPPYNHGAVICGQGTMALELMEQVRCQGAQLPGVELALYMERGTGSLESTKSTKWNLG